MSASRKKYAEVGGIRGAGACFPVAGMVGRCHSTSGPRCLLGHRRMEVRESRHRDASPRRKVRTCGGVDRQRESSRCQGQSGHQHDYTCNDAYTLYRWPRWSEGS